MSAHNTPSTPANRWGVPDQCPSTPSAGKSCHFPLPKNTCIFAGSAQRERCSTLHQISLSAGGPLLCRAHLRDNLHKESKQLPSKFQISIKQVSSIHFNYGLHSNVHRYEMGSCLPFPPHKLSDFIIVAGLKQIMQDSWNRMFCFI